ncbi:MAG TPA: S8 family serine peptidase [Patescibacteria group bacterium]|nr:S8 family serine peptidase [Patescibacteria group bacterium]
MKYIVTFFVLFSTALTYSQQVKEKDIQIILQLKSPLTQHPSPQDHISTGNVAVDRVSLLHKAIQSHLLATGKIITKPVYVISFQAGTDIRQVISEYYRTGEIDYAEEDKVGGADGLTPDDARYSRQWALKNTGNFSVGAPKKGADIKVEEAWALEQGDSNLIIGIIDSGTKLDHPEFAGRIWKNPAEIPNNGIDDDENGYIDDITGWDFVNSDNLPVDDNGHGTSVAGIIGANGNNGIGIAGINWNSRLMIVKGLNQNAQGNHSWWAEALYYAVNNGAKLVNMSLSSQDSSITLKNAIDYALNNGVVIVASMGNVNNSIRRYPAAYTGVIAVGATNPDDTRAVPFFWDQASGSNYNNYISVVAPGQYIYSTHHTSNTNYDVYWSGTSFAAPHVTGVASLLLSRNTYRTPAEIKRILEVTADDGIGNNTEDTPGWDRFYGHGRLNAFKALSYAIGVEITQQPLSVSVCSGMATRVFAVEVRRTGEAEQIQYQWYKDNRPLVNNGRLSGATMSSLQITSPDSSDAGTYFVKVSTGFPNKPITSSSAQLTVSITPSILKQPAAVSFCKGEAVALRVAAIGTDLSYQWKKNGIDIPGAVTSEYMAMEEGDYSAVLTNFCGQISTQMVYVTELLPPVILSQPVAGVVCDKQPFPLQVHASGSDLYYQWKKDGQDVFAQLSLVHTWEPGQYSVTVSNTCGIAYSDTITVEKQPEVAIITQPVSEFICEDKSAVLTVEATGGDDLAYQWMRDSVIIEGAVSSTYTAFEPGNYSVVVSNSCDQALSNTAAVSILEPPAITRQPTSGSLCKGGNIVLSSQATGSGLRYEWEKNGVTLTGQTSKSLMVSEPGHYSVIISNACYQIRSSVATVEIIDVPEIITQPHNIALSPGSDLLLQVRANNAEYYQWLLNGNPIPGATSDTYSKGNISQADAGVYSVKVSNKCGDIVSEASRVNIVTHVAGESNYNGFYLRSGYPNPFIEESIFEFYLPFDVPVVISIYDALGREIAVLLEKKLPGGHHSVLVKASDINFIEGLYFLNLRSPETRLIQSFSYLR